MAATTELPPHDVLLARTDGWICLPDWPPLPAFHPDSLARAPFTTYVSGLRNLTGLTPQQREAQASRAQCCAPFLWSDPYDGTDELRVAVTDLGAGRSPAPWDLGVARGLAPSAVPLGRVAVYAFGARGPGTYLYRLDAEGAARASAGTTGVFLVRARQSGNTALYPSGKYAYDDEDGSTGYDREFVLVLSELWVQGQWSEARNLQADWRHYRPDFALLNGRTYPDTLRPSGSVDPFHPVTDAAGDLTAPGGAQRLRYQPYSSLITCNAGERVLLRFANLGLRDAAMALDGPSLRVVGRGSALVRSPRRGESGAVETVSVGAGEVVDAILTAPPHGGGAGPDRYRLSNQARPEPRDRSDCFDGQRTELRVYPASGAGTLPPQTLPNT